MDKILIIDFGSQVTQLIARRTRESGVFCEIFPFSQVSAAFMDEYQPKGIILSGGPASVAEENHPSIGQEIFNKGIPILGICYGQQLMVSLLEGQVVPGPIREFGRAFLTIVKDSDLFYDVADKGDQIEVWMSHGDEVIHLPAGFEVIGSSEGAPNAAIVDESRKFYGVQFHPEVIHTPLGFKILQNFIHRIAECQLSWSMVSYKDQAIEKIKNQVGNGRVICGLSGGVDSSVAAVLIHEAIGDQLTCVFINNGLLRQNEAKEVVDLFREKYKFLLVYRDASDLFLTRLKGVSSPEKKRKIIGATFIDVFEEEAKKIGGADFLAQGTLYTDVIESVTVSGSPTHTIKSHHNVGGLPEKMNMKLVEPLRELFKDEVRKLGKELGLPSSLLGRHPFPGPGLAVRILGEVTREKVDLLQKADIIFIDELRSAGLYNDIWQAFAVLLPVNTVGVMGDQRTYESVVALRAVTATDGMTADTYPFDHAFLSKVSGRIVNEVKGINRVVYDITSKPPGTIEWE